MAQRLAACVQVSGPITSTYRWKGAVETSQEWQCWAKSRRELYGPIEQAIRGLHPYEEPEILGDGDRRRQLGLSALDRRGSLATAVAIIAPAE